jgi:hypothetical protein
MIARLKTWLRRRAAPSRRFLLCRINGVPVDPWKALRR